jgi:hypothetical protein
MLRYVRPIGSLRAASLLALLVFLGATSGAYAQAPSAALESELQRLIADYVAKKEPINILVRRVKWSGISDPRFFDKVEADLLASYMKRGSSDDVQYNAWLVQYLAVSGLEKYRPTIQRVFETTTHSTLRRHSESSLRVLTDFAAWNPAIAKGIETVAENQLGRHRVMNMLQANDPRLVRAGASSVFDRYVNDREITNLVAQQLMARYTRASDSDEVAEAVAWLCKALGGTGHSEYIPFLEKVLAETRQQAVKRHAKASLAALRKGEQLGDALRKD